MGHASPDPRPDGAPVGAQAEQSVGSLHRQLWPDSSDLAEERAALARENDELREAIDSRAVIEQAKGALILRFGLDEDSAFGVLRRWSQESNIKLRTIADSLVNDVCSAQSRTPGDPELAGMLAAKLGGPPDPSDR